ncbi:MAG: hypothetical protein EXS10_05780 [Phycisphaerales bacterium]|nr:hypothetical protein [Phycisphaerales bacterium]
MFAKICIIILVLGATAGALLVNRQQRVDAAAEISRMHFKLHRHERAASRLRAEIATAVRPDQVRALLTSGGEKWEPILYRYNPAKAVRLIDDETIAQDIEDHGRLGG